MPINSCRKGKRGERDWARWLSENLGDEKARRGASQGRSGSCRPDVECSFGVHWEVKHQNKLNLDAAMSQAIRDCQPGMVPAVAHRKDRSCWSVTVLASDLIRLSQLIAEFTRDDCGANQDQSDQGVCKP